ncbi:MAG: sensor histidine kinase [Bacteroidia bacterium]|jgi:signal transduction histidine kinase
MMLRGSLFKNTPRPLLVFYLLVVYVFLQFAWWSYLLFELNAENLKLSLSSQNPYSAASYNEQLRKKQMMIFGEGAVFLGLLALGVIQTRKSFKRETEAARLQKNFLLSVTHELKSPIAAIRLFLETLQRRTLEPEKQKEIVERSIAETVRLDQLVGNILLAAQLENKAFHLHTERLNMSTLCESFAAQFNARFPSPRLITILQKELEILADGQAMQSILLNLCENAIKYSEDDKTIELNLLKEGSDIILQVADTGVGVAPNERKRIFTKFYRSGNEEVRHTKGTGLGLYIVAHLCSMQHIRISVRDNQPKGSIFELHLNAYTHAR